MAVGEVAAVILAAGRSLRMGQVKINLPWPPLVGQSDRLPDAGQTDEVQNELRMSYTGRTVLGQVVATLMEAGMEAVLVVTGAAVPAERSKWEGLPVRLVHNPRYAEGEMLSSLQAGLRALPDRITAALVVLGDQPQIQAPVVRLLLEAHRSEPESLIVPSHQMRRGHPWLLPSRYWDEVLKLEFPDTLKDFLSAHSEQIHYVLVDTDSVLQDIDTPDDYLGYR